MVDYRVGDEPGQVVGVYPNDQYHVAWFDGSEDVYGANELVKGEN